MWFAGLVIGGLIGSLGGFGTAFLGAILGTIVGAVLGASGKSDAEQGATAQFETENTPSLPDKDAAMRLLDLERKIDHIYKALADIHSRLVALEKPSSQQVSLPDTPISVAVAGGMPYGAIPDPPARSEDVASPVLPVAAAIPQRSTLTVEEAVAIDGLGAAPLENTLSARAPASPPPEPLPALDQPRASLYEEGQPDRKWLVGMGIGAVVGLTGGFSGAVLGAILGAVLGMVVSVVWELRRANEEQTNRPPFAPVDEEPRSFTADDAAGASPATAAAATTMQTEVAQEITPVPVFASAPEPAQTNIPSEPAAVDVDSQDRGEMPPTPAADSGPKWWHRLFEGNIVAKVGAVILFFGTCFLLKFAYDHTVVPVPLRLLGVAVCGFAMVYGGWWLLGRRRLYGLILQGAGVGVLYIDVFFALKVFALIHPTVGFALFMVLGVAVALLAVRQDSKVLAVLGLTGAFLAPVLASTGSGNHVLLFSYYTLLNGFIIVISWFKSWRDLNLTGFIFTFVVALAWGSHNYQPELFGSVEPFVLIFFAMYLVIPILFASRQPPELKGLVDATLVFGTPLSVAFMQASLVRDLPYGLAWSAGCGAALYALLAVFVIRREGMRLLGETYIALSVVLATLAIFFALDAYPTFALWTLEGAAIVWVGLRQQRVLARAFGLLVQLAGAGYFLMHYNEYDLANPWFNDFTLGCMFIFVASTVTAWLMHKYRSVLSADGIMVANALLMWGCAWWLIGGVHALNHGMSRDFFPFAALMLFGVSALVAEWAGSRLAWLELRKITRAHLLLMFAIAAHWFMRAVSPETVATHPFAQAGYAAWPFNFAVLFWCLHRQMRDGLTTTASPRYYGGWILMALLATWMATWLMMHDKYLWAMVWGALGVGVGWIRYRLREVQQPDAWPLSVATLLWGLVFWFAPGLGYIHDHIAYSLQIAGALGFAVVSVVVFETVGSFLGWAALRRAQLVLPLAMVLTVLAQFDRQTHPFADYGFIAWAAAFALLFGVLARQKRDQVLVGGEVQNSAALALLAVVLTWEVGWLLSHKHYALSWAMGVAVMAASYLRLHWSERDNPQAVPVSAAGLLWSLAVWLISGCGYIREYVPHDALAVSALAYVIVSVILFEAIGAQIRWTGLRRAQLVLPLAMVLTAADQFVRASHPLADYGFAAWPAAFATLYMVVVRHERDAIGVAGAAQKLFAVALLAVLITWEAGWLLAHQYFERSAALALAALAGAYLRFNRRERDHPDAIGISAWVLVWGLIVWLLSGLGYIDLRVAQEARLGCVLGFVTATCALGEFAGAALGWRALRRVQWLLLPAMVVTVVLQIERHLHPAAAHAWVAWLAAYGVFYAVLYRQQKQAVDLGADHQHVAVVWMAAGLLAWESAWQFERVVPASSWSFAAWGIAPALVLLVIASCGNRVWPWREKFGWFRNVCLAPVALYCVLWSLWSAWDSGRSGLFSYIPVLNPIDLAQIGVLCGLYAWLRAADESARENENNFRVLLGALGFVWVNAIVLRTIHHWGGVPYVAHDLFNSIVVQAAFSLLWTLTAMVMMVAATRRLQRKPWFAGAVLLAVVVGKLFLLDLANSGTVARIVSFLGVGVLLMIIGYVAPVPPGDTEKQQG